MSASDHLGAQWKKFHGTNAELSEGDLVEPRVTERTRALGDTDETPLAHVTSHPLVAASYGKHVYEVVPTGIEREHGTHTAPMVETIRHWSSTSGYRVLKKVEPNEALFEIPMEHLYPKQ